MGKSKRKPYTSYYGWDRFVLKHLNKATRRKFKQLDLYNEDLDIKLSGKNHKSCWGSKHFLQEKESIDKLTKEFYHKQTISEYYRSKYTLDRYIKDNLRWYNKLIRK